MRQRPVIDTPRPRAWVLRGLLWIGCSALLVLVLAIVVFAAYRLRGPSTAQRDALVLMQQDRRPVEGDNAFDRLWFLGSDVAERQIDARMAADIEAVRKRLQAGEDARDHAPAGRRSRRPRADAPDLCRIREAGCLAQVIAQPLRTREALARYQQLTAEVRKLERSDLLWNDFPPHPDAPFGVASGAAQSLWLTDIALQYAEGNRTAAIAGACRNIGTWRRLRQSVNGQVMDRAAALNAEDAMRLLADMWARQPVDEPAPEDCVVALRPVEPADLDRCSVVASEFALHVSAFGTIAPEKANPSRLSRMLYWLMIDHIQTAGMHAERLAFYCKDAVRERMFADQLPEPVAEMDMRLVPQCLATVVGCRLLARSPPSMFGKYDRYALDFAAHLRLAATLLWLRNRPMTGGLADRFAQRPPSLRSNGHISGFDAARGELYVDDLEARHTPRFGLGVSPEWLEQNP